MEHLHVPTTTDRAFDAEVGGLTPEEWYQAQQRAVALHIEQVQQQAQATCAQHGEGSLECAQAWERANQAVEAITREAARQPQVPYTPPSEQVLTSFQESIPMPKPFVYPESLPSLEAWPSLAVGERRSQPLLDNFLGNVFLQYGYTISRQATANPKGWIGLALDKQKITGKLGPWTLSVAWGEQGVVFQEVVPLPSFLAGESPVPGTPRPRLTFELRPQGFLGINTLYTIYYEDQWEAEIGEAGRMRGTSGVFVSLALSRIALAGAAVYLVVYLVGTILEAIGGPLGALLPKPIP